MFGDQEGTIRGIGTPTDTGKAEWSVGQMRHCLAKETASSFFCFLRDLVFCKWYARPSGADVCQLAGLRVAED